MRLLCDNAGRIYVQCVIQSLKTLSGSISKLKEAASKTVANKSKPETASQKSAPQHHQPKQPQQKQPSTTDLKAKADALRKEVCLYVCECAVGTM